MSRAAALIVCFALAAAACGDAKHEPVKVIATARDRAPLPDPPPTATPPTVQPAPPVAPAASVPARPTRSAAASVPALPGFNDRPPRFIQPGEPTGNDAFRRAFADRAASRPR